MPVETTVGDDVRARDGASESKVGDPEKFGKSAIEGLVESSGAADGGSSLDGDPDGCEGGSLGIRLVGDIYRTGETIGSPAGA